MEQQDNPYEILGVREDATDSQIRSAYRKAALRNHPDKVSEEERPAATKRFAKISNAYEILSDPEKRRLYHEQQAYGNHQHESSSDFFHQDPFFMHRGFHDPFQVFRSVFREEFGGPRASFRHRDSRRGQPQSPMDAFFGGASPFQDPFFQNDPFFGANDDFFGGGSLFGRRGGGGSRHDPFADMFDSMRQMDSQMRRMEEQMRSGNLSNGRNNGNHQSFYYSSSSSSMGRGGETVTTQTTRRIVNGQEETITERIVQKADGTVERQVLDNSSTRRLQDGGNRAEAALPSSSAAGAATEDTHGGFSRLLPWRRRKSNQVEDVTPSKRSPAEVDPGSQKRRREP